MARTTEFNGQFYVRRQGGWARADEAEAEILRGDPRAVAVKAAVADIYGLGNLVKGFTLGSVQRGRAPMVEDAQDAAFASAVKNFQQGAEIHDLRPGPAGQGSALIEIASLFPAARLGRMSQRVAGRIAPQGKIAAGQSDAAVDRAFGASSVGAAQGEPVKGMGKFFRSMTDNLDDPRHLSPDQYDILESGLWDEVGFEFPMMSLNNEQSYASILSNPLLNRDILPSLFRNSQQLSGRYAEAIGLDPAQFPRGFGRRMVRAGDQHFATEFRGFERALDAAAPDGLDLAAIADDIKPFMQRELRAVLDEDTIVDGRTLFEVRSRLNNDVLPRLWRGDDVTAVQLVEDSLNSIDNIIRDTMPAKNMARWRQVQQQYRTFLTTKRPGVIDRTTGELSLKSLAIQLEKQYPAFARTPAAGLDSLGLSPSTTDLLKFARVARSFSDSLADSGTATRSIMSVLNNPKASMKFGVMRHSLDQVSLTPQQALELAR